MPKSYAELDIVADQSLVDQLIGILSQLGFEGFWEDADTLKCYMSGTRWNPEIMNEVQSLVSIVTRSSTSPIPTISLRMIEDQNWNEEWERTIRPIHATDRIVVAPTWHPYKPSGEELVITIDPKMSFGTGYHESTRLLLKLMEKYIHPGMSLLDVGTGTGVLAIAGIKLGAKSALAVDNDEWSYGNALENIRLNHVHDQVRLIFGDLSSVPHDKFDIITANIQRSVIEQMLEGMKARLAVRGLLLLSGLLHTDREAMIATLMASGFKLIGDVTENEWLALGACV
jgi:ribosomal protein L11 methyltransferase